MTHLLSPETPRPEKSYGQLHLNGYAYTYLGLKCSTRPFYCTLDRLQPMYVEQQHGLSMYSNWKICTEVSPEFSFTYHSRPKPPGYTFALSRSEDILTHSSQRNLSIPNSPDSGFASDSIDKGRGRLLSGGFESNDDYTYIRGRGRGRYVCEECGIRCKKPSMLEKHLKTHSNVRPYTCGHCSFSFKTKGNLTKHMKSKMHYKKFIGSKMSSQWSGTQTDDPAANVRRLWVKPDAPPSSSEDSDGREDSEDSGSEQQEAVSGLLNLARPFVYSNSSGIVSSTKPSTYPYTRNSKEFMSPLETLSSLESESRSRHITETPDIPNNNSSQIEISTSNLESRLSNTHVYKAEPSRPASPIDLSIKSVQSNRQQKSMECSNISQNESESMDSESSNSRAKSEVKSDHGSYPVMKDRVLSMYRHDSDRIANNFEPEIVNLYKKETNLEDSFKVFDLVKSSAASMSRKSPESEDPEEMETTRNSESHVLKREVELPVTTTRLPIGHLGYRDSNDPETHSLTPTTINPVESSSQNLSSDLVNDRMISLIKNKESLASDRNSSTYFSMTEDGHSICSICNKIFNKQSQLRLHMNIHYFERPFKCDSCGTSFRTKGHLMKHERSSLHHSKVHMTSAFGAATANNPRPFKCSDCELAFRIHGHLAKHLRSKMHIMKLECLHKLPFGTYAEIERSGMSLNEIDTTDCSTSLASLRTIAQRLLEESFSNRSNECTKVGSDDDNDLVI